MTLYILDTDTCSYIIRKNPIIVLEAMDNVVRQGHEIAISAITYADSCWARNVRETPPNTWLLSLNCANACMIYMPGTPGRQQFADLQTLLFNQGTPIGVNDTLSLPTFSVLRLI